MGRLNLTKINIKSGKIIFNLKAIKLKRRLFYSNNKKNGILNFDDCAFRIFSQKKGKEKCMTRLFLENEFFSAVLVRQLVRSTDECLLRDEFFKLFVSTLFFKELNVLSLLCLLKFYHIIKGNMNL